jgi:hypothetical protein
MKSCGAFEPFPRVGPGCSGCLVLSYWARPRVDVWWSMCIVGLGTSRFGHKSIWPQLVPPVEWYEDECLWSAPGYFFVPLYSLGCWLWRRGADRP